jgi:hypothetical protein
MANQARPWGIAAAETVLILSLFFNHSGAGSIQDVSMRVLWELDCDRQ